MVRKEINAVDFNGSTMRDKFFPVLFRRITDGRGHDAEIGRALVGTNVEEIAAMIDVVFVISLPRQNHLPCRTRIGGWNVTKLVGRFAVSAKKNYGLVQRLADANVKQFILLFVDQFVLVSPEHVPEQFVTALG